MSRRALAGWIVAIGAAVAGEARGLPLDGAGPSGLGGTDFLAGGLTLFASGPTDPVAEVANLVVAELAGGPGGVVVAATSESGSLLAPTGAAPGATMFAATLPQNQSSLGYAILGTYATEPAGPPAGVVVSLVGGQASGLVARGSGFVDLLGGAGIDEATLTSALAALGSPSDPNLAGDQVIVAEALAALGDAMLAGGGVPTLQGLGGFGGSGGTVGGSSGGSFAGASSAGMSGGIGGAFGGGSGGMAGAFGGGASGGFGIAGGSSGGFGAGGGLGGFGFVGTGSPFGTFGGMAMVGGVGGPSRTLTTGAAAFVSLSSAEVVGAVTPLPEPGALIIVAAWAGLAAFGRWRARAGA
jgi:hypothetical protein